MNIQPLEHKDLTSLAEVQPDDWPDILPSFNHYSSAPFCFPLKVVIDGTIAGIGAAILHEDVAWLGHIIVSPRHRNKGIGTHITQSLVNLLKEKKCRTIYLIATDLGAPVYEKLGFETETEYLFFKDLKIPAGQTSENIFSLSASYTKSLLAFDEKLSGENRSMELQEHLSQGYIYQKNNTIEGYYLPGFGEGLILAETTAAGIELMKLRFTTHDKASFPKENSTAKDFLYQHQYQEFKTAKRMWMGEKRNWQPTTLYNRIGGNIG